MDMWRAVDIGFTIPGQARTYWNRGPGPGKSYLEDDAGHEWSKTTGKTAAQNLVATAKARSPRSRYRSRTPEAQPQGVESFVGSVGTKSACGGRWAKTSV